MMKRAIVFLALVTVCGVSMAVDFVWESKTTRVRITEKTCETASLIAVLSPHTTDTVKTAFVTYNGRDIAGCWIYFPAEGLVMLADTDGDIGGIYRAEFKEDKGI